MAQLASVPVMLMAVGTERYGVIGFLLLIQALVQCCDLGLVATFSRELARLHGAGGMAEGRSAMRAFEILIGGIGVLLAIALVGSGGWLAREWMNPSSQIVDEADLCVRLAAVPILSQLLMALYSAGLQGLERQGALNLIRGMHATVAHIGGALAVSVTGNLCDWVLIQGCAGLCGALAMRTVLVARLPPASGFAGAFSKLWRERKFIRGMGAIGLMGILIGSLDRLVVSRFLPLEVFARYSLAVQVGNGIRLLTTPVFNVIYPRMVALHAAGDVVVLRRLYRLMAAAMAAFIVPVAIAIACFPVAVMAAWTRDHELAQALAGPTSLIVIGTALNGLLTVPYALQLAYGDSGLPARLAAVSLVLSVVGLAFLAPRLGDSGAAMVWPMVNLVALVLVPWTTHRRWLKEASADFLTGLSFPFFACCVVLLTAAHLPGAGLGVMLIAMPFAGAAAVAVSPDLRPVVFQLIRGLLLVAKRDG